MPTIIIASIIALLVLGIIVNEIKKRKNGKGGCSCGCSSCALKDKCHKDQMINSPLQKGEFVLY